MTTLTATVAGASYPIHIGAGLVSDGAMLRKALPADRVLVVTDSNVAAHHLPALLQTLGDAVAASVVLEPGESNKDLAAWARVSDALAENSISRDGAVVALGGGVVGDIAGFAAATYMRGIPVIQIPTSLIAQVDAAIGGKTAIDHPKGKNLIGAFHQPSAVIADINMLSTLDERQYRSAIAEIIKHALIADEPFFCRLEDELDHLLQRDTDTQLVVVARCCEIKAGIVADDEKEAGQRAWLNLGHSFGHAIEFVSDYTVLHGEAVSAGLVLATSLAVEVGRCAPAVLDRVTSLLSRAGLPIALPEGIPIGSLLDAMAIDKKRDASGIRLVLPEAIGRVAVVRAPKQENLRRFLNRSSEP